MQDRDKEPYIDLFFRLSHKAPKKWCEDFNKLSKDLVPPVKINENEGVFIDAYVRDMSHIKSDSATTGARSVSRLSQAGHGSRESSESSFSGCGKPIRRGARRRSSLSSQCLESRLPSQRSKSIGPSEPGLHRLRGEHSWTSMFPWRTHQSLNSDAPDGRRVRAVEPCNAVEFPAVHGLHHVYRPKAA